MIARSIVMVLGLFLISQSVWADTGGEIQHLLTFIANSTCVYIRNQVEYDAPSAADHIKRKYDYAKRWIRSSEDFIEYAASASSTSGRPYRVRCDGSEQLSSKWLQLELERFRALQEERTIGIELGTPTDE